MGADWLPQLANWGTSMLMMPAQLLAQYQAEQANLERYNQGLDELTALRERGQADFDLAAGQVTSGYRTMADNTRGAVSDITGNLNNMYQDRYNRNMGYFEGAGEQERADIKRRFANAQNTSMANLRSRGLVGSTIAPAVRAGNARRESDAMGALDERLRQQRIGLDASLSGDVAANYGQNAWAGLNLNNAMESGYLNNLWSTEGARRGWDANATGNLVGWIGGRTDSYPNEALYASQLQQAGAAQAPAPNYPSPSYGPSIASGFAPVGGAVAAKAISPQFCVDGETPILTPDGPRPLKEIGIGDEVINQQGRTIEVVDRDYGIPIERRRNDYIMIQLAANGGPRIICTRDHLVGGRMAGEWRVGEGMPVVSRQGGMNILTFQTVAMIRQFAAVPSGDLRLADESDYLTADGFIVGSMMSHYGIRSFNPRRLPAVKQ